MAPLAPFSGVHLIRVYEGTQGHRRVIKKGVYGESYPSEHGPGSKGSKLVIVGQPGTGRGYGRVGGRTRLPTIFASRIRRALLQFLEYLY